MPGIEANFGVLLRCERLWRHHFKRHIALTAFLGPVQSAWALAGAFSPITPMRTDKWPPPALRFNGGHCSS